MKKRVFKTLVKGDHKLSGNDHVLGFINGLEIAFCVKRHVGWYKHHGYANEAIEDGGMIIRIESTKRDYNLFAKAVEDLYPGLCEFDV